MGFWVEGVERIVVQQDSDNQTDPDSHGGWSQMPIKYRMQIGTGIEALTIHRSSVVGRRSDVLIS